MFETLKSFLHPQQRSAVRVITVTGPVDHESVPVGFFRVRTASGKESLGYRGSFISWKVGPTVVDGAQRVTLTTPREELPLVELNYQRPAQDGVQYVGGASVIDTDTLDGDTGVSWAGPTPHGADGRWV